MTADVAIELPGLCLTEEPLAADDLSVMTLYCLEVLRRSLRYMLLYAEAMLESWPDARSTLLLMALREFEGIPDRDTILVD